MSSFEFVERVMTIGGAGTPPLLFYKKGFNIGGSVEPTWQDIILSGNTALTLVNAKANSLEYLKLFGDTELLPETYIDSVTAQGKCELSGTATPSVPINIVSNNGTIKVSPNLLNMNDLYGNYLLTDTGQVGNEAQNFYLTNFIRVLPNTTYTFSFISGADAQYRRVCGYSSADQTTFTQLLIKKARPVTVDKQYDLVFTTDANTNYIRISTCVPDTNIQLAQGSTAPTYRPYGQIYTDGTTETVTDNVGNVATCQMLLGIENSIDTQEILSGAVTRDIDITVLDGSETFAKLSNRNVFSSSDICPNITRNKFTMYCTHFVYGSGTTTEIADGTIGTANTSTNVFIRNDSCTTVTEFQQWLKDQYTAGTPVIIVYQRQDEATETVSGQVLQKSPVTYAGSLSGLTGTTVTSSHTVPTPTAPLQINCNNGVLGIDGQGNITVTGTTETVQVAGNNLLDTSNIINGYRLSNVLDATYSISTGDFVSGTNYYVSNLIPVEVGKTYIKNSPSENANHRFKVYNSNKVSVRISSENSITIQSGEAYIAFCGLQTELTTAHCGELLGTATAKPLYKVGTYQDVQSVIDGGVTRNVGIKVLDGTEDWEERSDVNAIVNGATLQWGAVAGVGGYSTHLIMLASGETSYAGTCRFATGFNVYDYKVAFGVSNITEFKQYLATQYAQGTPVIIVYPLATATTETVTAQPMNIQAGTNIVQITQASMDNLELEVKYKAGVAVTIEEIENAQLDDNVEVTING